MKLPIGTKIRFTKSLSSPATDESPACEYAKQGEIGVVVDHNGYEGYWVKSNSWPNEFGASDKEFEVV